MRVTAARSYQFLVRMVIRTTESITGTSTKTPTTVASTAPESKPNSTIAVAQRDLGLGDFGSGSTSTVPTVLRLSAILSISCRTLSSGSHDREPT